MAPTIHFVRHAQGYHNLSVANQAIRDPLLTPYGEQQCLLLSRTFPYTSSIDLIVASPLKRTIYTALLSFPEWKKPLICVPEFQETSAEPCDTGSSKEQIAKEFAGKNLDLALVVDDWNSKKGKWGTEHSAIEQRAMMARQWLRARPEQHIVVVTHGGLLHYLTEDWVGSASVAGTGWANTEYRSYTFDLSSGDSASLIETPESRTMRHGTEKPLSEAEQRNLKSATKQEWAKYGYVADDKSRLQAKV